MNGNWSQSTIERGRKHRTNGGYCGKRGSSRSPRCEAKSLRDHRFSTVHAEFICYHEESNCGRTQESVSWSWCRGESWFLS